MPDFEWQFTLVLLTNGIMIGLMYALIALGFVLIYKATDAINFAQGEFVMFAGFLTAGAATSSSSIARRMSASSPTARCSPLNSSKTSSNTAPISVRRWYSAMLGHL